MKATRMVTQGYSLLESSELYENKGNMRSKSDCTAKRVQIIAVHQIWFDIYLIEITSKEWCLLPILLFLDMTAMILCADFQEYIILRNMR